MRRTSRSAGALARCALFTALVALCSQLTLNLGPVPFSLSLLPVLLAGALLPPGEAALSLTAYLLLGAVGVPVFSGFGSGLGKLLGPTGGYLLGYLPAAVLVSAGIRRWGSAWQVQAAAMAAGVLACYALGTVWFLISQQVSLSVCLRLCVWPFLPWDAVKIALAVLLSLRLRKALRLS